MASLWSPSSPAEGIAEFFYRYFRLRRNFLPAFVMFSDVVGKSGEKYAKYILDNGLGTVAVSETKVNGNSGNLITAWIWSVDEEATYKWLEDASKHPNLGEVSLEKYRKDSERRMAKEGYAPQQISYKLGEIIERVTRTEG